MKMSLLGLLLAVAHVPLAAAHLVEFKSPGAGMHFTVGQPVVVYADLFDDFNVHGVIVCPAGQTLLDNGGVAGPAQCSGGGTPVGWPQFQVLVDGTPHVDSATQLLTIPGTTDRDSNGNPDPINFHRFGLAGLPVGDHQLKVRAFFPPAPASNGATVDGTPITITVEPLPTGRTTLSLSADVTGPVSWNGLIVLGNGRQVRPSGSVTIVDTLVIGLGSDDLAGIDGSATALDIRDSVFEATGAIDLTISGAAAIRNSEFRANNRIRFLSWNPDASPVITLSGRSSAPKFFQGNRIGAGRVVFDNTNNWLIGGDGDAQSNVIIGPRGTINLERGTSQVTIRGNYVRHNYRGGWSQGFNLYFSQVGSGVLVEHNVFRGASWPIQNIAGEFRYNLVYGFGHTWVRGAEDGTSIHHNVFAPEQGGGEVDQGIWLYGGERGVVIRNNTFDGGGTSAGGSGDFPFAGPVVQVNNASQVASLRNNLLTYTTNRENGPGAPHVVGDTGTFGNVDHNSFYSPDNSTRDDYAITGMAEGSTPGFATHDVSGSGALGLTDGQLAQRPHALARIAPYESVVDEAALWNRTQALSAVLAEFRRHYAPAAGSPIIDAGDPADDDTLGRRADIGAIDATDHDFDRFGKFGQPADLLFRNGYE